jgi:hypothetical protein
LVVIQNKRADIRPGYLQDTKLPVFRGFLALSVKISAHLAASQSRDISVGIMKMVRVGYPRNRCSIPDRATEIPFIHTVHTGFAPKYLLQAQVQTLLPNLLQAQVQTLLPNLLQAQVQTLLPNLMQAQVQTLLPNLLQAQVQTLLPNLLRFCERASAGVIGRSSLHIPPVRRDGYAL